MMPNDRVVRECSACREIQPQALARLARLEGDAQGARATDALLEVRQEGRRGGCSCEAPAARSAEESVLEALPAASLCLLVEGEGHAVKRDLRLHKRYRAVACDRVGKCFSLLHSVYRACRIDI